MGICNEPNWELKRHSTRLCRFPAGPLLKRIEELDDPGGRFEKVFHLTNARVVFADIELLQHDFPDLRDAASTNSDVRPIIEKWLLERAAVISLAQVQQSEVNTPIPAAELQGIAYRPTRYGRTLVVSSHDEDVRLTEGAGLLEVKGIGITPGVTPTTQLHRSGLMQLGEALQDTVLQSVIEAIFFHANSCFSTVPLYAVLHAGFDAYTPDGRPVPAGLQVRRAHRRPLLSNELPEPGTVEEALKGEVEMLLRHYGVTSCKDGTLLEIAQDKGGLELRYGGRSTWLPDKRSREILKRLAGISGNWTGNVSFDGINVQLAREVGINPSRAQLVDFGQYTFRDHFFLPALNLSRDRPLMWGSALYPGDVHYARVNPRLSIPSHQWHGAKSWNLADRYNTGAIRGEEVLTEIHVFLKHVADKWRSCSDAYGASGLEDRIDPLELDAAEQARLAGCDFSRKSELLQNVIETFTSGHALQK